MCDKLGFKHCYSYRFQTNNSNYASHKYMHRNVNNFNRISSLMPWSFLFFYELPHQCMLLTKQVSWQLKRLARKSKSVRALRLWSPITKIENTDQFSIIIKLHSLKHHSYAFCYAYSNELSLFVYAHRKEYHSDLCYVDEHHKIYVCTICIKMEMHLLPALPSC